MTKVEKFEAIKELVKDNEAYVAFLMQKSQDLREELLR